MYRHSYKNKTVYMLLFCARRN